MKTCTITKQGMLLGCLCTWLMLHAYIPVVCEADIIDGNDTALDADSLAGPCVGNWSSETVWTMAYDTVRDLAFLGSCGCVHILDVSLPDRPVKISEFRNSTCNACGLYYQHNTQLLYVCSGITGLSIWDVADPADPQVLGRYDSPGYALGVHVSGSYAYLADADGGLRIVDVSVPAHPVEINHLDMDAACCVYIQDAYAYVADLGLRIIDISDPMQPVERSFYETPGVAYSIQVMGDYAYVADDWCGLRVIDISDNEHPREVGYLTMPGYAWAVYVKDSFAYVSACDAGLMVVDVANPAAPRKAAHYGTAGDALHAYTSGSHIYVAAAAKGLQIYANRMNIRQPR